MRAVGDERDVEGLVRWVGYGYDFVDYDVLMALMTTAFVDDMYMIPLNLFLHSPMDTSFLLTLIGA